MTDLIALRKYLHRNPERSGEEARTAEHITGLLEKTRPSALHTGIAGHGIVAVYGGESSPAVLLRADLDALPIAERNDLPHTSEREGTAHLCGHDGHMSILVGAAERIAARQSTLSAPVAVLFQPSEETGQGAEAMLQDTLFSRLHPKRVFALHNIPGYARGTVLLREGPFAMASIGVDIHLTGRTSHAAEPEKGNSPVPALLRLAREIMDLPADAATHNARAISTIIHLSAGSEAFGTTPGDARLLATLRTDSDEFMDFMKRSTEEHTQALAREQELRNELSWREEFPSVRNAEDCVALIRRAAQQHGMSIEDLPHPFPWSEDFAHFTHRFDGALFGIGAGADHAHLHSGWYDFPDEIIAPAVDLFDTIVTLALER
ncbi:MAG: amidohydrolase [Bacteroidetes bacterium]|nr:amidohydrolase [Bacteroidota bacterium]